MAEQQYKRFRLLEQKGEPVKAPDGKGWTKTFFSVLDLSDNSTHDIVTFSKGLKIGEEVEGFIEPSTNPQWKDCLRLKSSGQGGGGNFRQRIDENFREKMEISTRQTALNNAVAVVNTLTALANPDRDGVLMLAGKEFSVTDNIDKFFKKFHAMLLNKSKAQADIEEMFDGQEVPSSGK